MRCKLPYFNAVVGPVVDLVDDCKDLADVCP